jgi:hypothetical protein
MASATLPVASALLPPLASLLAGNELIQLLVDDEISVGHDELDT